MKKVLFEHPIWFAPSSSTVLLREAENKSGIDGYKPWSTSLPLLRFFFWFFLGAISYTLPWYFNHTFFCRAFKESVSVVCGCVKEKAREREREREKQREKKCLTVHCVLVYTCSTIHESLSGRRRPERKTTKIHLPSLSIARRSLHLPPPGLTSISLSL